MAMSPIIMLHVITGTIAVVSGATALTVRKGSPLHRGAGNVFLVSMLAMAMAGAYMAITLPMMISVLVGVFTCYLVVTAWTTVKRKENTIGALEFAMLLVALGVAAGGLFFGLEAANSEAGSKDGFSAEPYYFFAGLALLAAAFDVSVLVRRGVAGRQRIARHLWRMCFAYFIAAGSLFTGPGAKAFPEVIRETGILSAPEPIILFLMLFWMIRVLFTKWYEKA